MTEARSRDRAALARSRCETWAREVELALAYQRIARARFRQAQPDFTPTPGINARRGLLRGRMATLIEIETESRTSRHHWSGIAVATILGSAATWAFLSGLFTAAWKIVIGWFGG